MIINQEQEEQIMQLLKSLAFLKTYKNGKERCNYFKRGK